MWNPFKPKKVMEVSAPVSYEMVADIILKKPQREDNWRTGMWVVVGDKPAILYKIMGTVTEVHFTDEDGVTILIDNVSLGALRQAKYVEIPAKRRTDFNREVARGMGYGD